MTLVPWKLPPAVSCSRSTEARGSSGWSRAKLIFSFLLLAVFCGAALPQEVTGRPLKEYLAELTGPRFTHCGYYDVVPADQLTREALQAWQERQKRVLDCAMNAVTRDEPFIFLTGGLAIDSEAYHGWVRTLKGELLSYSYDSAPCGVGGSRGGSRCKERFETAACPDPNVYTQGAWLAFRCEKP